MTAEDKAVLDRINKYAEEVLGEIDPQKTPVSFQLEKLKPVMEEIAREKGLNLEDVFIHYMDIQSEAACASDRKLKSQLSDLNEGEDMPLLYRDGL